MTHPLRQLDSRAQIAELLHGKVNPHDPKQNRLLKVALEMQQPGMSQFLPSALAVACRCLKDRTLDKLAAIRALDEIYAQSAHPLQEVPNSASPPAAPR